MLFRSPERMPVERAVGVLQPPALQVDRDDAIDVLRHRSGRHSLVGADLEHGANALVFQRPLEHAGAAADVERAAAQDARAVERDGACMNLVTRHERTSQECNARVSMRSKVSRSACALTQARSRACEWPIGSLGSPGRHLLIVRDLGITLLLETRVDDILRDAELLPKYRHAGIEHIYVGVESVNQATLDLFKKDT